MHTDEICRILVAFLQFYLAIGLMGIGFAFMVAGKDGGARVARFYFAGSLHWVAGHTVALVRWIVLSIAALIERIIAVLWRVLCEQLLGPLAQWLRRLVRWSLATPRRVSLALAVLLLCALTLIALAGPAGAQSVRLQSPVHLIYEQAAYLPLKTRTFLDHAAPRLKEAFRALAN